MTLQDEPLKFITIAKMADQSGGVHTRTIRKSKSDPEFPKLTLIGGKYHAVEREWENYKKILIARDPQPRMKTFPIQHSATRKVPAA